MDRMFRGGREVESRSALARSLNLISLSGQHDASSIPEHSDLCVIILLSRSMYFVDAKMSRLNGMPIGDEQR